MARVVAMAVLVALLLVPSASAKGVGHALFVGADGRAVNLGGGDMLMRAGKAAGYPKQGGYLLVYTFLRSELPVGTGPLLPGRSDRLLLGLPRLRFPALLPRGAVPAGAPRPGRCAAALHQGADADRPSAAERRRPGAQPHCGADVRARLRALAQRPGRTAPETCALSYVAHWAGPEAATRPTAFCLASEGVYANGKLYLVSPQAYAKLVKP